MGVCFNELAPRFYLLLSLGREDGGESVEEVRVRESNGGKERKEGRKKRRKRQKSQVDREHLEVFSHCSGEHSSVRACLFIC